VVLAAARAAHDGADLDAAARVAEDTARRVGLFAFLDTLEHLKRGGRAGEAGAILATRLHIRALLRVADGRIRFVTARRSREAATEAMLSAVQAEVGEDPLRVGVLHGACPREAEALAARLPAMLNVRHLYVAELTPVMGAHAGPGTLCIGYERLIPDTVEGGDL